MGTDARYITHGRDVVTISTANHSSALSTITPALVSNIITQHPGHNRPIRPAQ